MGKERRLPFPPVVCMNGGAGMPLPFKVNWPDTLVSWFLLGGQDYFKGKLTPTAWLVQVASNVPRANKTTVLLLVNEMSHMPNCDMLLATLHHMILGVAAWKEQGSIPIIEIDAVLGSLVRLNLSGRLQHTVGPSQWRHCSFDGHGVRQIS